MKKNITEQFNSCFKPVKALLIYHHTDHDKTANVYQSNPETQVYVESYDIGRQGQPINAHPLTLKEITALSQLMQSTNELKGGYLKSKGILPQNVLYLHQQADGYVIWYTPPREVSLFFADSLKIPSGRVKIPAMIWKATAEKLSVYALKGRSRPAEKTQLYHAPYLNIYHNGNVCMGTVAIRINRNACLEDFMQAWEQYFLNSYFSHSINGGSSTKTDTIQLWRKLRKTGLDFPQEELLKIGFTLKHIIE